MNLPVIDETLAARLIQSETAFYESRIRSIGERPGNPEGVEIRRFGNAAAFYIKTMPWGLFNSVKGFARADIDRLDDVISFYRERNRVFQMDVDPLGFDSKALKQLAEKGLYQDGFQSVLYGVPASDPPPLPPNITIRQIENEADFDHYAGIHCVGSGMDIKHKHHFYNNNIGLLHRPGWKMYLALWDGTPAAVAVMFVDGGIASFTLAATAPEFRRRGLQTALLRWRMHEAYRSGCELVAAQASFDSSSRRNMERIGMRVAWMRAIWKPLQL